MIAASVDDSPHLRTLKRVGIVTLAVGLADVVFMVYCLANGLSYSSSFNIFAVAAGILLIRGSLAAAEWTRFFATFTAAGFGGLMLIWPAVYPPGLMWVSARRAPWSATVGVMVFAALMTFLIWTSKELASAEVLAACRRAGRKVRSRTLPIVLGIAVVAVVAAAHHFAANSEAGQWGIRQARAELGDGYSFHVSGLWMSGSWWRVDVTAWSDSEIKTVSFEHRERPR